MTAVDQEGRTSRGTADLRPEVTWPPPALPGGSSTDGDASTRRRDAAIVAVIAAVAGLVATVANAEPTGRPVTDFVLVGVGVAVITALGSRAPWWMLALIAASSAIALEAPLLALAAIAFLLPVVGRLRRIDHGPLFALSAAITFNVLIRADDYRFFGLTAIVGTVCAAAVFVTAVPRCSKPVRRMAWIGAVCAAVVVAGAAAGIGYAVYTSRHALTDGLRNAERGVSALEHDDYDEAARLFQEAAADLDYATDQLDQPWARPAAVVPVLAQHRSAVVDMSATGAVGATTVATALDDIDLDALRVVDGRIDVDALVAVEEPLEDVREALDELQVATDAAQSPWLVPRARTVLDDFDQSIAEHVPALDSALAAVRMAPDMLGADGSRRYLLLFTTPSEARGLGGFIGSYAELTADEGQLVLSTSGHTARLDADLEAAGARVEAPAEFVSRYGEFGYGSESGRVGDAATRNLSMTPHFPWVGEIAASFYEQTTGRHIDGVIAIDPFVIAKLLEYTGPIDLPAYEHQLAPDNAVNYLLHDQYVTGADDNTLRREVLADVASTTFNAMMAGGLPDPIRLAGDMGPLVEERRMLFWSSHADEQELLGNLEIDGALPELDGSDGWAFTVANAVGNKIDSYLERRASYEAIDVNGTTRGTLRIELTNTAPAEGLPNYIIGGGKPGLPSGTSRLYLSVYSALGLDSMTVDGERVDVDVGVERGWNVFARFIVIPAGETATIEVDLARVIDDPDTVVTWVQPLARPLEELE